MKGHTKLTSAERTLLAAWKQEGLSNNDCAKRLGRHRSTIGRELKRNHVRVVTEHGKNWTYTYEPLHAQHVAEARKENAWDAKEPLKNKKIYAFVLKHLRKGWSPEQIAGRLKKKHPHDASWYICHETIYAFIYKKKSEKTHQGIRQERVLNQRLPAADDVITMTDQSQPLYEYLRRKQKRRRKRSGRKSHRVRIPDRVSIHDRPKAVNKRKEFGHWEGDSIVGKGHASGLHTEYERVSSLTRIEKMERITGEAFACAVQTIFGNLPKEAKRSTTLDNGSEHVTHTTVQEKQDMHIYFADPYSSWQRGGNENANMWIRYYFPKGTDFSTITDEEIRDVEWELNNRPRKRLNYKTPQEVFDQHLANLPKGCNRS